MDDIYKGCEERRGNALKPLAEFSEAQSFFRIIERKILKKLPTPGIDIVGQRFVTMG